MQAPEKYQKKESKSVVTVKWLDEDPQLKNPVRNTKHEYLRFLNTEVFSHEARNFLRHGYYTNAPRGSKDWVDYWDEQEERCANGYTSGGVRITGRHYFFLNFTLIKARPVDPLTGKESDTKKILTFPRFLDHQYYLFHEFEECFAEGEYKGQPMVGMCILKSRRKGISYVNAGGVYAYNFNFIPFSNSVMAAYETAHYNALLNGVHFALNHINKQTDWAKRRQKLNTKEHFRASIVYKNDLGIDIEDGYMSEIQAKSFKDDPFKSIGESAYFVGFEEAGRFKGLIEAYTITEPTFRDGDIMTGVPVFWGTGGDIEKGGKDIAEIFYKPAAYGCKGYNNIYDENAAGDCGWFIDDMWYLPGEYVDGKTKTKVYMVDEFGNSYRRVAEMAMDSKREIKMKGSRLAFRKFITQQPKTPKEALLRVEGSVFDTMRANERLADILMNQAKYVDSIYLVKLRANPETGVVYMEPDNTSIPLREYPIQDWDAIEGCIEIYEPPVRDASGEITPLRYIAGIDSYDDDSSSSDSVGSILVLDRLTDRIVCHYKGRPAANKFYENCRLILKYYNATANYERRNKGIYGYFFNKQCLHLLCDEPQILKEKGISKATTAGNNSKGTAPSVPVNSYGRELAVTWEAAPAYGEDPEKEIVNMDKIRSIALLQETIAWNPDGNFDDISALGMLMIYREDLAQIKLTVERAEKTLAEDDFWTRRRGPTSIYSYDRSIFTRNRLRK